MNTLLKLRPESFRIRTCLMALLFSASISLSAQSDPQAPATSNHQNSKIRFFSYSLNMGATMSGNGLGVCYQPSVAVIHNKGMLAAGLIIHPVTGNSGMTLNYSYTFNPISYISKHRQEVYICLIGNYIQQAPLCQSVVEAEKNASGDQSFDAGLVRLTVAEAYLGFGTRIAINKHLKISGSIATGMYRTLDSNIPGNVHLCHQDHDIALRLGIGLLYSL